MKQATIKNNTRRVSNAVDLSKISTERLLELESRYEQAVTVLERRKTSTPEMLQRYRETLKALKAVRVEMGKRRNPTSARHATLAQVEDARGVRYTISIQPLDKTNQDILNRATDFYGKKMVRVVKKNSTTANGRKSGYLVSGTEKIGGVSVPISEIYATLASANKRAKEFLARGIGVTVKKVGSAKRNATPNASKRSLQSEYAARYGVRGKWTHNDSREVLNVYGIDLGRDVSTLNWDALNTLHDLAILSGYKKARTSGSSLGAAYYAYLSKARNVTPNAAFKWETRNPNLWVLLYGGELFARVVKNNERSYTASVNGENYTFVGTLAQAKMRALALARKHITGLKAYRQSQPTLDYVNRRVSKSVIAKHGRVTRIEPVAFESSKYRLYFADGYSADTKIPKQRNATANGREREFQVLMHPRNSQSRESSQDITVWTTTKAKAIAKVKADARSMGVDTRKYTFQAFEKYPRQNTTRANSGEMFNRSKIAELSAMFNGAINGKRIKAIGSDFTPDLVARAGGLSYMKIRNGNDIYELRFNPDNAWLGFDARKNMHIAGKDTRLDNVKNLPPKNRLHLLGDLEEINYITAKSHIENGDLVEYYHKLGEVDGVKPNVWVDYEGFLIINSGNYDVGVWGIEN